MNTKTIEIRDKLGFLESDEYIFTSKDGLTEILIDKLNELDFETRLENLNENKGRITADIFYQQEDKSFMVVNVIMYKDGIKNL